MGREEEIGREGGILTSLLIEQSLSPVVRLRPTELYSRYELLCITTHTSSAIKEGEGEFSGDELTSDFLLNTGKSRGAWFLWLFSP